LKRSIETKTQDQL